MDVEYYSMMPEYSTMEYSLVHWCTIWFNKVCSGLYVHLLTEAAVIFGMWHMLLTTSVAFDSLSDSNRLQSLHVRPLYLYHLFDFINILLYLYVCNHTPLDFWHSIVSVFNINFWGAIVMHPVQVLC